METKEKRAWLFSVADCFIGSEYQEIRISYAIRKEFSWFSWRFIYQMLSIDNRKRPVPWPKETQSSTGREDLSKSVKFDRIVSTLFIKF